MTPRISDESWQLLWGHILHGSTPTLGPHGLPIGGKVEFDIDLNKARWYGSWIAASHRDTTERVPLSHTISLSHWRSDSKTSSTPDQADSEHEEPPLNMPQNHTPISAIRHVPRKLSLVDRFESFSTPSASRPASRTGTLLVESFGAHNMSALSPTVQADEPETAKLGLEKKVKNWRASAPSDFLPIDETTVRVGNIPIGVSKGDISGDAEDASSELNLDDFTWSVSSAGPVSNDVDSPLSSGRLSSIHIDRRLQESVCLTPSSGYRAPSNHLGDRADASRPGTPSTVITQSCYPPTPSTPSFNHNAGRRAIPYDGSPWTHVWPPQSDNCDVSILSSEADEGQSASRYPYLNICELPIPDNNSISLTPIICRPECISLF
jgi:hypothetical protein